MFHWHSDDIRVAIDVSFRELDNSVSATTDGLFGITKYPAKFIPQVVNYVLDQATMKSDAERSVIDPFAGVGTVAISAHLRHIDSELWDINPMMSHYQSAHRVALNSLNMSLLDVVQSVERRLRQTTESEHKMSEENVTYLSQWYHPDIFRVMLSLWSTYMASTEVERSILLAPLIRISNKWSYNDLQRQKLSRSKYKHQLIEAWISTRDWRDSLLSELAGGVTDTAIRYLQHGERAPWKYDPHIHIIKSGTTDPLPYGAGHIVVTSPPYLQAQEYIRSSKLPLLWLEHTQDEIRAQAKLEIPYGKPDDKQKISSPTFDHVFGFFDRKQDTGALSILRSYFTNSLKVLERSSASANEVYLFVGSASLHGTSIPLDIIFAEHFTQGLDWTHVVTLSDHIVGKTLFKASINPTTGRPDERMTTEQMVILKRKG